MTMLASQVLATVIAVSVVLWLAIATLNGWSRRTYHFDTAHHSFIVFLVWYRGPILTVFITGVLGALLGAYAGLTVAAMMLVLSALYALLLWVWLSNQYESYCHCRWPLNSSAPVGGGPSPYTGTRYALTWTLVIMSLILFVIGLLGLVIGIADLTTHPLAR